MYWVFFALSLIPLAFALLCLRLFARYLKSPERAWKKEVLARQAAALAAMRDVQRNIYRLDMTARKESYALREQFFDQFLAAKPTNDLEAYPGIGQGTVSKLYENGFKNLAQLRGARLSIPGIGEKRLADVQRAVELAVTNASDSFDKRKCRQGREYVAALAEKTRAFEFEKARLDREARQFSDLMDELFPFVEAAGKVTFGNFIESKAHDDKVLVPAHLLKSVIPSLKTEPANNPVPSKITTSTYRVESPIVEVIRPGAAKQQAMADAATVRVPKKQPAIDTPPKQNREQAILEMTIEFVCAVARYDHRLSKKEEAWIEQNVILRYKHDAGLFNRAKALFAHYKTASLDVNRCLESINALGNQDLKRVLMTMAAGLLAIQGKMTEKKAAFARRISETLNVPLPEMQVEPAFVSPIVVEVPKPPQAPVAEPIDPRKVLEIEPSTPLTADLVRRNYLRLREKYSPDRVSSMGPEFVAVAERKSSEVKEAALLLMAPFKEDLEPVKVAAPPQDLRHNPDLDSLFGA